MTGNRHPRGLPPQYPYQPRRGSNTPLTPLGSQPPPTPNRSRSLDGLLDSDHGLSTPTEKPPINIKKPSENGSQSCESLLRCNDNNLNEDEDESEVSPEHTNNNSTVKRTIIEGTTDCNSSTIDDSTTDSNSLDDCSEACDKKSSTLSLHSNSSESKRKRNFMDRCVNKVRSLIKK